MNALQVALLGGFPGNPLGDKFFGHAFSNTDVVSENPTMKTVYDSSIITTPHKYRLQGEGYP
jgi:hypothetical protein